MRPVRDSSGLFLLRNARPDGIALARNRAEVEEEAELQREIRRRNLKPISGGSGDGSSWVQVLATAQVDGPAVTNTTPVTVLPGDAVATLPNKWSFIGRQLRITASGRISNIVTTPGTLTLDVRFGSVIVWNGGAFNLNVVAKTNVTWTLSVLLTVRAVGNGTNANVMGVGTFASESVVGSPANSAGGVGVLNLPATAPVVGAGYDSTAVQTVNLFATWSINNAGNTLTLHQYTLEALN